MKVRATLISGLAAVCLVAIAGCDRADRERSASNAPSPSTAPRADNTTAPRADNTTPSGGAQQAGAKIDDATITTKVKTALLADKEVSGTEISVDTNGGRVKLTGNVPPAQIKRAEEIARGVDGVQGVDNQLKAATS